VVSDLELSGQLLEGWCHLRNAERVFRLSEILSVGYA
jgi:predicted DNA-binding transcriptional regulator YafY